MLQLIIIYFGMYYGINLMDCYLYVFLLIWDKEVIFFCRYVFCMEEDCDCKYLSEKLFKFSNKFVVLLQFDGGFYYDCYSDIVKLLLIVNLILFNFFKFSCVG